MYLNKNLGTYLWVTNHFMSSHYILIQIWMMEKMVHIFKWILLIDISHKTEAFLGNKQYEIETYLLGNSMQKVYLGQFFTL